MLVWKHPSQCPSSCCLWGQLCPSFSAKQQNNSPRNMILCHTHHATHCLIHNCSLEVHCRGVKGYIYLFLYHTMYLMQIITVKFWSYLRNILVSIFSQALCILEISSQFAHIESLHMKENTFELFGTYSILGHSFSRTGPFQHICSQVCMIFCRNRTHKLFYH